MSQGCEYCIFASVSRNSPTAVGVLLYLVSGVSPVHVAYSAVIGAPVLRSLAGRVRSAVAVPDAAHEVLVDGAYVRLAVEAHAERVEPPFAHRVSAARVSLSALRRAPSSHADGQPPVAGAAQRRHAVVGRRPPVDPRRHRGQPAAHPPHGVVLPSIGTTMAQPSTGGDRQLKPANRTTSSNIV